MLSPPSILNTLLLLFCSLFLFSECSNPNDPRSTIICVPGDTMYNVTLAHGINAGVFTAIHSANTLSQCIQESCNRRAGQIALLIENSCFMVDCFREEYCQAVPNKTPKLLRVAVTRYTFVDAAPVFQNLPRTLYLTGTNDVGKSLIDITGHARSRRSDNATVYFNITSGNIGNTFKLVQHPERRGASLVANVVLNRENISSYYITIQATNVDEQKISTAPLRVVVLNFNDSLLRFPRPEYNTTIKSNVSIGTEVFQVNAIDSDTGENAKIRYRLNRAHSQFFEILPETGNILVKQRLRIDRSQTYTLIVAAIKGKYQAVASVNIKVVALNEFRPFFQRLNYQVNVSEDVKVGTSVVRISATDNDVGSFSNLKYFIISGNNNLFRIDNNGDVRTMKPLYNLGVKNFTFRISVRDSGNPPLESLQAATLVVLVTPTKIQVRFEIPLYFVVLMENIPVGSRILNVRAVSELDERARRPGRQNQNQKRRIVYTMEGKDDAQFFRINNHTGVISTKRPIDYEEHKEFRLTVVANDAEAERNGLRDKIDHAIVRIKVIDLNDNRPQFVSSSYRKVINENTTIDSSILRVTANDADAGMNKNVEYIMQHGNINNTFSLDPNTGTLRLSRSLAEGTTEFYNLTVLARDMGLPRLSSKPVYVYLKVKRQAFVPTRRPGLFPVPIYIVTVDESCPLYSEILRVGVRMPAGKNIRIRYFTTQVTGGADMHFAVNTVTGGIILIRKLDYKKRNRYEFQVNAIDINMASWIDKVLVRILVKDVN